MPRPMPTYFDGNPDWHVLPPDSRSSREPWRHCTAKAATCSSTISQLALTTSRVT